MEFIITDYQDYSLFAITGRIDSYSAPQINKALNLLIDDGKVNIIVDMAQVSYVSSSGILAFVNIQKRLKQPKKGEIVFSNVPELILSTFKLSGFDQFFDFYDSVNSASSSF